MCGRFTQDVEADDLAALYELDSVGVQADMRSRWNGAPTQAFAICRNSAQARPELAIHRWGLIPAWARDEKIGARLINARSETVDSKPSFRNAFRRRRCLVPASGWFEWQQTAAGKQPWWISLGGEPFSFAGLWETWDRGDSPVQSFTILTCQASPAMEWLHHRQPAIIPRVHYQQWLDPSAAEPGLLALARTPLAGPFDCRQVSTEANSPKNDYPELLAAR